MKKAIIFDLDNTIFPVASIGHKLFFPLLEIIEAEGNHLGAIQEITTEIMRRPFQVIIKDFGFSNSLTEACVKLLAGLTYNEPIEPFEDYLLTRSISCLKFLVTTGFTKMQSSKIEMLGIRHDFTEIFIVDPTMSGETKKDIFKEIMDRYNLSPEDLLVIGDDLNSEIKAGKELGIKTILYDYVDQYGNLETENVINHFSLLEKYLDGE